jgi:hypothetical protein
MVSYFLSSSLNNIKIYIFLLFFVLTVPKYFSNFRNLKNICRQDNLESEKTAAISELSRGKAGAVATLREELERKLEELKEKHEKEKKELKAQWEEETTKKLQACEKDKQVNCRRSFLSSSSL